MKSCNNKKTPPRFSYPTSSAAGDFAERRIMKSCNNKKTPPRFSYPTSSAAGDFDRNFES